MNPSPIAHEYMQQGRSDVCPIYDMHGHIGPFYGGYLPAAQIDVMRQQMKRCGVVKMLCSHHIALRYADEHRLLVKVHTFGHSSFNSPDQFGTAAARYPNTTFLMAHCGYGGWEKSAQLATDLANVYLDITSMVVAIDFKIMPMGTFMPIGAGAGAEQVNGLIEYFCDTAGSRKIVFGSDLPWYSQHYHAGAVLFARVTDNDRHNIMHRNAESILEEHL